jgi:hypothetical protein
MEDWSGWKSIEWDFGKFWVIMEIPPPQCPSFPFIPLIPKQALRRSRRAQTAAKRSFFMLGADARSMSGLSWLLGFFDRIEGELRGCWGTRGTWWVVVPPCQDDGTRRNLFTGNHGDRWEAAPSPTVRGALVRYEQHLLSPPATAEQQSNCRVRSWNWRSRFIAVVLLGVSHKPVGGPFLSRILPGLVQQNRPKISSLLAQVAHTKVLSQPRLKLAQNQ